MSERNKFNFGDVTAGFSEILNTATVLTDTAKNIGSTVLSMLLRKSSDIGDRPNSKRDEADS